MFIYQSHEKQWFEAINAFHVALGFEIISLF